MSAAASYERLATPSYIVIQGRHRIARCEDIVLSTLLGSCVAACLWDEAAGVGGMNHFLLPAARTRGDDSQKLSLGVHAMELLINDLFKAGASRSRLQAKLFGGAWLREGLTNIGEENAAFAEHFLKDEGIPVTGGSLGGDRGRRLQFWPMSGRARQIFMRREDVRATAVPSSRAAEPSGDLELF